MQERQRVKVALFKGEPVSREDFGTVRKVVADLLAWLVLAIVLLVCACSQLLLSTHEHGTFRWMAASTGLVMALTACGYFWQRRRILKNASKLLGSGSANS